MMDIFDLRLQKAVENDFPKIRAFYDAVIDKTKGMEKHARWKKGSHPSDCSIRNYIKNGDMYICMHGEQLAAALAVPFYQDEEYRQINWGISAADNEVATLHLFAVAPELQGKGCGKAVMALAIGMASDNGMKVFRLDAIAPNAPAHRLYASIGFQLRGKQHLYTDNVGWVDFYYYEKSLQS